MEKQRKINIESALDDSIVGKDIVQVQILVVEDEPAHAEIIKRAFEIQDNYHVEVASKLGEAKASIAKHHPDLIISDMRLPDGNGIELLELEDHESGSPVMIMTSYGDQNVAINTLKAGAADYIVKTQETMFNLPKTAGRVLKDWHDKQKKKRILDAQERLVSIMEATPDLIATTTVHGKPTYLNKAGRDMLGLATTDKVISLEHGDFQKNTNFSALLKQGIPIASKEGIWQAEKTLINKMQQKIPVDITLLAHANDDEKIVYFSTIMRDLTEDKKSEKMIKFLAYHDSLTKLPNRNLLIELFEDESKLAKKNNNHGALLFIDLDNFKKVNDALGHPFGDRVLQIVAERMQSVVGESATLARLGGDEFVVVKTCLDSDADAAIHMAQSLAEQLGEIINLELVLDNEHINLTASIGVAMFTGEDSDGNELLRLADAAMYHAKKSGKNTHRLFYEGMDKHFSGVLALEAELRQALKNDEFELYYQPKFDLSNGKKVVGAEALLRWRHPTKGVLLPNDFLDTLHSSGLIHEVGRRVFKNSLARVDLWLQQGRWNKEHRLSINVSPQQFREESFVHDFKEMLERSKVPASCIDIEVTEHVVINNVDRAIERMTTLTDLGVSFSLDDFGTGYSSLSYLKRLPVSNLKIDKSFVDGIHSDKDDQALVGMMLGMAKHLGLQAIAEGVETKEQLNVLVTQGCDCFQGYHFSRPLPVQEFEKLL